MCSLLPKQCCGAAPCLAHFLGSVAEPHLVYLTSVAVLRSRTLCSLLPKQCCGAAPCLAYFLSSVVEPHLVLTAPTISKSRLWLVESFPNYTKNTTKCVVAAWATPGQLGRLRATLGGSGSATPLVRSKYLVTACLFSPFSKYIISNLVKKCNPF